MRSEARLASRTPFVAGYSMVAGLFLSISCSAPGIGAAPQAAVSASPTPARRATVPGDSGAAPDRVCSAASPDLAPAFADLVSMVGPSRVGAPVACEQGTQRGEDDVVLQVTTGGVLAHVSRPAGVTLSFSNAWQWWALGPGRVFTYGLWDPTGATTASIPAFDETACSEPFAIHGSNDIVDYCLAIEKDSQGLPAPTPSAIRVP